MTGALTVVALACDRPAGVVLSAFHPRGFAVGDLTIGFGAPLQPPDLALLVLQPGLLARGELTRRRALRDAVRLQILALVHTRRLALGQTVGQGCGGVTGEGHEATRQGSQSEQGFLEVGHDGFLVDETARTDAVHAPLEPASTCPAYAGLW